VPILHKRHEPQSTAEIRIADALANGLQQ